MIPYWLSFVDIGFLIVVLMFAWGGLQKGFAAQIAPLLTFFFSAILLFFAYPALFSYFSKIFRGLEEAYLMWLLLLTLLALGIAIFVLFSKLIAARLKKQFSERADKGFGFGFGLIRGFLTALIAMIILVMLDRSGASYEKFRIKSQVGKLVCYELLPHIQPRLTTLYENKINVWKSKLLEQEEAGDVGF